MQLSEADYVLEAYSQNDANKAIKEGWKLLAITSGTNSKTTVESSSVCYVLGRKKTISATSAPLNV